MSFWEFEKLKHSLVIQRQKSTTTTALEDILWQLAWIHYCWNVRSENSYETSNCLMQQLPRQCKGAVLLPDDKANLPFCVISLIQSDILFMWASLFLSVCLFVLFGPNKSAEIDERGPKQNQKKVDMEAVVALTKSSWRLNDDGWNVNDWDLFSLTWLIHTMFFYTVIHISSSKLSTLFCEDAENLCSAIFLSVCWFFVHHGTL